MVTLRFLFLPLILSVLGCQAADDSAETHTESLSVTLERVGSLGDETSDESFLGAPRDVVANGNRIFVADGGRQSILVFDHEGSYLTRFGRAGRGPGEFGHMTRVWADDEQLLVFDDQFMRITRFAVDGTVISVHPYSELGMVSAPTAISRLENGNYLFTAGNGFAERFGTYVMHEVSPDLDRFVSSFGEKEQIFGEHEGHIDFSSASTGTHLTAGDQIIFSPRVYAGKLHLFEKQDGEWVHGGTLTNKALSGAPFTLLSSGSDLHPDRNYMSVNEDGSFDSFLISNFSHSLGWAGDSLLVHLVQLESVPEETRNVAEVYDVDTGTLLYYGEPSISPGGTATPLFRNLKMTGNGQVIEIRVDSLVQLNRFRLETVRESSRD